MDLEAEFVRGVRLHQAGQLAEAEAAFRRILSADKRHARAMTRLATLQMQRGETEDGLRTMDASLQIDPKQPLAHANRGNALSGMGDLEAALAAYDRALALEPNMAATHFYRGNVLVSLERFDEALRAYDECVARAPSHAAAHGARAMLLLHLRRFEEALSSADRSLKLLPSEQNALHAKSVAISYLASRALQGGAAEQSLALYDEGLRLGQNAELLAGRAHALRRLNRSHEAVQSFERAAQIDPDFKGPRGEWLYAKLQTCDWNGLEELRRWILARIDEGQDRISMPFPLLLAGSTPEQQKRVAHLAFAELTGGVERQPLRRAHRGRIRLGYFSNDFYSHATAVLISGLIERHDRAAFEVLAFSYGPRSTDPMRARLERAFDAFIDIGDMSDEAVTALAREKGVDIAIDLKGFTVGTRLGFFARGVAPIQAAFLGYPGTSGAAAMDYIIADRSLIEDDERDFYAEKVVRLPGTYQPNDRDRPQPSAMSRAQMGLPEDAFVFASFNNNFKILPAMFDVWMRVLQRVDNSVLWLLAYDEAAMRNLRDEAAQRGVDPKRLYFARPTSQTEFLARQHCADLFLDTAPCSAHTSASDAVWTGLPLLTLRGETFAGRVAASILSVAGLSDLIASDFAEYEAKAVELATDRAKLADVRARIAAARAESALFDIDRFARGLDEAYREMWARHQAGQSPDHIDVVDQA